MNWRNNAGDVMAAPHVVLLRPAQARSTAMRMRMTGGSVIGLWRPLRHHKARPLQMSDQPVRGDAGHHAVSVVDTLAAVVAKCKRQCLGEFIGRSWAKGRGVRHLAILPPALRTNQEQILTWRTEGQVVRPDTGAHHPWAWRAPNLTTKFQVASVHSIGVSSILPQAKLSQGDVAA
jgi:hypothetical protein